MRERGKEVAELWQRIDGRRVSPNLPRLPFIYHGHVLRRCTLAFLRRPPLTDCSIPLTTMPEKVVETPYPLIDADPHAGRVIRYMRLSDLGVWAAATGAFPAALYFWGV